MRELAEKPQYLTEREVARLTGLAVPTLRNWRCLNRGPRYVRPNGRMIRYRLQDVLDYMEQSAVETEGSGSCRCGDGR